MRLLRSKPFGQKESDMLASDRRSLVSKAKVLYESMRLRLEREFGGQFVAIEPESQEFFVGKSFDSAVTAARTAHPNRVSHTIRIGHQAAFHIGLMER
jgi:hypothetical protein